MVQHQEVVETSVKSGVGFLGSFGALTINDAAGLVVAILTGIYMILQIESALKKRKKKRKE